TCRHLTSGSTANVSPKYTGTALCASGCPRMTRIAANEEGIRLETSGRKFVDHDELSWHPNQAARCALFRSSSFAGIRVIRGHSLPSPASRPGDTISPPEQRKIQPPAAFPEVARVRGGRFSLPAADLNSVSPTKGSRLSE